MKKWFRFFGLSFFSHKIAKEGAKRGYTNTFLGFVLVLVFLFANFIGGDMLPFGLHYSNSPDFMATAHGVFVNADVSKRIDAEIKDGTLWLKKQGSDFTEGVLINTLESDSDRQTYSVNGFNVVVDSRPANTLAEIEAYCVNSDGTNSEISYEDYLTLSDVKKINFDFKIRYTGNALVLDDKTVEGFRAYVDGLNSEAKASAEKLGDDLKADKITKDEYNRAIYELYFTSYYPEITAYESTSKVPLLRNYYYHQYLKEGISNYLFIFDDYMTGAFKTNGGVELSFYGFYSGLENGTLVREGATQEEACASVDSFIKNSFKENWIISAYAHFLNVLTLAPFIALMLMVATLLAYSILKLCGVESITSLGATLKIVGSFVWFSGAIAAVISLIIAFFVNKSLLITLPLVVFFVTLVIRSVIFVIKERELYKKQSEQEESIQAEV